MRLCWAMRGPLGVCVCDAVEAVLDAAFAGSKGARAHLPPSVEDMRCWLQQTVDGDLVHVSEREWNLLTRCQGVLEGEGGEPLREALGCLLFFERIQEEKKLDGLRRGRHSCSSRGAPEREEELGLLADCLRATIPDQLWDVEEDMARWEQFTKLLAASASRQVLEAQRSAK